MIRRHRPARPGQPSHARPTTDRKALANSNDYGDLHFNLVNLVTDWEVMNHQVTGIVAYQDSNKSTQNENDRAYSVQYINTEAPTCQVPVTKTDGISYRTAYGLHRQRFWNYMGGPVLPGPEHHNDI